MNSLLRESRMCSLFAGNALPGQPHEHADDAERMAHLEEMIASVEEKSQWQQKVFADLRALQPESEKYREEAERLIVGYEKKAKDAWKEDTGNMEQ